MFEDKVSELATLQTDIQIAKAAMQAMLDELHNTPEWMQEASWCEEAAARARELDEEIRNLAVGYYESTQDKKPHPAVGIRVSKKLDYEEGLAIAWCEDNFPAALETRLIKKSFEAHAKATPLEFVNYVEEPSATISKDLSEYLPQE